MLATLPLNSTETLELFKQTGAYLRGHFRLTSGLHSPEYLQCALVLQYPDNAQVLGENLADRLGCYGKVNVVAAPAIGGLIIGHEVARHSAPGLFLPSGIRAGRW